MKKLQIIPVLLTLLIAPLPAEAANVKQKSDSKKEESKKEEEISWWSWVEKKFNELKKEAKEDYDATSEALSETVVVLSDPEKFENEKKKAVDGLKNELDGAADKAQEYANKAKSTMSDFLNDNPSLLSEDKGIAELNKFIVELKSNVLKKVKEEKVDLNKLVQGRNYSLLYQKKDFKEEYGALISVLQKEAKKSKDKSKGKSIDVNKFFQEENDWLREKFMEEATDEFSRKHMLAILLAHHGDIKEMDVKTLIKFFGKSSEDIILKVAEHDQSLVETYLTQYSERKMYEIAQSIAPKGNQKELIIKTSDDEQPKSSSEWDIFKAILKAASEQKVDYKISVKNITSLICRIDLDKFYRMQEEERVKREKRQQELKKSASNDLSNQHSGPLHDLSDTSDSEAEDSPQSDKNAKFLFGLVILGCIAGIGDIVNKITTVDKEANADAP